MKTERTHAYCPNCQSIEPTVVVPMDGDDVSGKFTNAADLKCTTCHFIIATLFNPKEATQHE